MPRHSNATAAHTLMAFTIACDHDSPVPLFCAAIANNDAFALVLSLKPRCIALTQPAWPAKASLSAVLLILPELFDLLRMSTHTEPSRPHNTLYNGASLVP